MDGGTRVPLAKATGYTLHATGYRLLLRALRHVALILNLVPGYWVLGLGRKNVTKAKYDCGIDNTT